MTAPAFRQLSRDEYEKLTLEERVWYMQQLVKHVRHLVRETQDHIDLYKKEHPPSE